MPDSRALATTVGMILALIAGTPTSAPRFARGDRVVVRDGVTIVPDNPRLNFARTPRVFVVGRTEGTRLWVIDDHSAISGSVESADVQTPADAIAARSEAIRRAPTARDLEARAVVRVALGEMDAALADYGEAIRLDPGAARVYVRRAHVWRARNDYDRSMADLEEAIRLDPSNAVARNDRGNGWRRVGQYGRARADYDEAIRSDPEYPVAYNNRAWLCATCPDATYRDAARAIADARRTCELTAEMYPNGFDSLAAAYAEAGDFARAVEWEEKAITYPRMTPAPRAWATRRDLYRSGKPFREQPKPQP